MFSSCPLCYTRIPFQELESHVNDHFMDDELKEDMELAQRIALAPPSPRPADSLVNYTESSGIFLTRKPASSISSSKSISDDYRGILDQEKISCLTGLQTKSIFYKIDGGLMSLLRRCLELEKENSRSVISGHVDHYQSVTSEDSGWGCGWRNIQMLGSHLLMQRQEARNVMFGGLGFVPNIPSLQRWLEIAWERGFDSLGSESFNQKIYGSRRWIGTTECATLFRSFGLRARIVDFDDTSYAMCEQPMQLNNRLHKGKSKVKQVYGPMDKFLQRKECDGAQMNPCETSKQDYHDAASFLRSSSSTDQSSSHKCNGRIKGSQALADWVWTYFTSGLGRLGGSQRVAISEKTPLYFQHHGHSRTIVGIQMHKGSHNNQDSYFLLILDPGHRTADLERSLRGINGWQKLIKRGVHTLRMPQYQLCYVDPGIAHGAEIEQLKTIHSTLLQL